MASQNSKSVKGGKEKTPPGYGTTNGPNSATSKLDSIFSTNNFHNISSNTEFLSRFFYIVNFN